MGDDGFFYTDKPRERAVLVSVITDGLDERKAREHLEELAFLADTYDVETVKVYTQRLERPDTRTFVGKGKFQEIKEFITENELDAVIFDDELSPSQVRNIQNELEGIAVMDRSLLILNIFNQRARTARAKTQVELARYQYILPRLTRMWTHLERQRGGTGTRGGSGEKELETDKRIVRDKITLLKEKLVDIDKQMTTQRKSRDKMVRVSLVGYTNVGKSTLMNIIAKSEVFAENKLFATLDSTVRKVVFENIPFLLTDTVGFIRKLPHTLVECFKSTLDEIREADLLLHVIDLSHAEFEDQMKTVNDTLAEIGAADKPVLLIFNKIDNYSTVVELPDGSVESVPATPENLKNTYLNRYKQPAVFISAVERINLDQLRKVVLDKVKERYFEIYPNYLQENSFFGFSVEEGE